jgi:hypothetical protein
MENNSIINWGLHQKISEKKYGTRPIKTEFEFNKFIDLENECKTKNKKTFSVQNIDFLNDGTIIIESYLRDRKKYYINSEDFTIHNDIPTSNNNKITLMCEFISVVKSISDFIMQEENRVGEYKKLLSDILMKEKN